MDKQIMFAIYYSNLVGIQFHPANNLLFDTARCEEILRRCRELALQMVERSEDICL